MTVSQTSSLSSTPDSSPGRERALTTVEKALAVNLDDSCYGTFAEIGAGQEVVRWFFQAGGAAGTISKSISAYDMTVSDVIYGDCDRYVSRQRLEAMLECEQALTIEQLTDERGSNTRFFTFADTVSARNYLGTNECHAWMGIRFQPAFGAKDDTIIIHARMRDDDNASQQEALGILGVNLIYGAFNYYHDPDQLIVSLLEGLSTDRIGIDMIDVHGPVFDHIDNRVLTLRLVEHGLTGAAMFGPDGSVVQPSEALRKRPLLVQRGRFRPITHVNMDLLESACDRFSQRPDVDEDNILPIMEMSLHNLMDDSQVCLEDFLSRAEVIATTGCTVMISDFQEYHRLAGYLSQYTDQPIGLAMGLAMLKELFEEKYYEDLEGGLLEGFGRLFRNQTQLLIYPIKQDGKIEHVDDVRLRTPLHSLFEYLCGSECIVPLEKVSHELLDIHSPNVLDLIGQGTSDWRDMVPSEVADKIIKHQLFGYAA